MLYLQCNLFCTTARRESEPSVMKSGLTIPTAMLTIIMLSLSAINMNPAFAIGNRTNLVPALIAALPHGLDRTALEVFARHGVNYVVLYGQHNNVVDDDDSPREAVAYAHSLGISILFYVTALQENQAWIPPLDFAPEWLQYNGSAYVTPETTIKVGDCYRFSPYGPYITNVLLPCIQAALENGADGIFLDTLLLHPECDKNPLYGWLTTHPELSFEQFRHRAVRDVLEKIHNRMMEINPGAILIVNNNNIFSKEDRDKFASFLYEWQDVADGFLLEIVGMDPYGSELSAVTNLVLKERSEFGVKKPIWVLYNTVVDSRFKYLLDTAYSLEFGYWAFSEFLISSKLMAQNGTLYTHPSNTNVDVRDSGATHEFLNSISFFLIPSVSTPILAIIGLIVVVSTIALSRKRVRA
jgi:hypothetical protein